MDIQKELFKLQDLKYRDFQAKLMPTVDKDTIIGVRTPQLRSIAKEFAKTNEAEVFLKKLPHKYYEENNVHACIIEQTKDYETAIAQTHRFLPFVDNWATCDMFLPKVFKKHTEELLEPIKVWMASDEPYIVRYGIKLLMALYLDEHFKAEYPQMVASVKSDEYYVNMMRAWYFATALAKQYDAVISFITENRLDKWTHNKTIQKAVESYRITKEQKAYLRTFRIK